MFHEWGYVDGDGNADAIIRGRSGLKRAWSNQAIGNFVVMAGCGLWYAFTGHNAALALEIIAASWLVGAGMRAAIVETHTMVMIAERRIQLVEQKLQDLANQEAWR